MIRTDKWPLQATQGQRHMMLVSVREYRAFCRALSIVVLNNWPELARAQSFAAAVERLIHPTTRNPSPRHRYFQQRFYKFPSYLRRAAIEFTKGQVSSYLTRNRQWVGGERKRRDARPPVFTPLSGCYPAMYRGQMVKFNEDFTVASLKLWDGREWLWHEVPIRRVRSRHTKGRVMSPMLVVGRRGGSHLSVPVELRPERLSDSGRVCSADLGINTLAAASIVSPDGTVVARRFLHPAADIDRRERRERRIRARARKTAKLSRGFCRSLYRKARHINEQMAQLTSRQLVDFALEHGADVIVLEDLRGWRPRGGGARRSPMRQRFHGWLHRRLAELVESKFAESGGRVAYVHARGTSAWAFDGSGRVRRDAGQHELATFPSGKRYNADLNASYNIAARYWAWRLRLTRRKDGQLPVDRSSAGKPRMPVTLSTLWQQQSLQQRESEAPHLCAA